MIFCECCFKDKTIAAIISSVSLAPRGQCPLCKAKDVFLYDTERQADLTLYFEEFLKIYTLDNELPSSYPKAEKVSIIDDIKHRWNIFSESLTRQNMYDILTSICPELYETSPELFDNMVGLPELYDSAYLFEHAMLKNNDWDAFVNEIKTKNRYHSQLINFEILEKYCTFIRKTYKAGACFYRGRISEKNGFLPEDMSAPPPGRSSEGRANARGITCLYLANDVETTLHEVRAGVFDYVSVGKFVSKKDITVVDLRAITNISPFVDDLDYLDHAINKQYLEKLNTEMSKPLRRSDSTLDYVPTQYIVDFIKSITHDNKQEYDGIEYNSTTNPGGYNLAIFNPDIFDCIEVAVYDIEKLQYTSKKI